jgi:hypothetical protein
VITVAQDTRFEPVVLSANDGPLEREFRAQDPSTDFGERVFGPSPEAGLPGCYRWG